MSSNIDGTYDSATNTGTGSLGTIATNINEVRKQGMKLIIRFAYTFSDSNQMASLNTMQSQLNQLKPILQRNKDVLYLVQAGFIGNYGEWWTTWGSPDVPQVTQAGRTAIKDAVLDAVPSDIPVQITCSNCLLEWWSPTPVTSATAFNGSQQARLGFHNDCFLASQNDQGNYPGAVNGWPGGYNSTSSQAQQRQWAAATSEFIPFGGETCAGSAPRKSCSGGADGIGQSGGILNEGPRYHLAHLGRGYDRSFMTQWQSEGCYDQVSREMGYRFQFDNISHSPTVTRGSTLIVDVNMRNVGWSRIFSARPLRVVLINGSQTITGTSTTLLRQLPSQATSSTTISVPVSIPAGVPTGAWTVALDMPDIYATTQANDYKIRPANLGSGSQSWDSTNYRFNAGTSVTIQ